MSFLKYLHYGINCEFIYVSVRKGSSSGIPCGLKHVAILNVILIHKYLRTNTVHFFLFMLWTGYRQCTEGVQNNMYFWWVFSLHWPLPNKIIIIIAFVRKCTFTWNHFSKRRTSKRTFSFKKMVLVLNI